MIMRATQKKSDLRSGHQVVGRIVVIDVGVVRVLNPSNTLMGHSQLLNQVSTTSSSRS